MNLGKLINEYLSNPSKYNVLLTYRVPYEGSYLHTVTFKADPENPGQFLIMEGQHAAGRAYREEGKWFATFAGDSELEFFLYTMSESLGY